MQYSIKYRPLNFTDGWFGNKLIADEFRKRSIKLDYPQAVLFKAQTGSGKTTAHKIIAKTLSCLNPVILNNGEHIPCENCQPCKSINNETFINTNVTLFNGNVTSGKADIEILESAVYNSSIMSSSQNKIIIIEEVHNLSNAAKERLLTLIEAPLKDVYFILITTEDFKLKLTNKNRCIPYHFNPLLANELMDLGSYILKKENLFEQVPDSFLFEVGDKKSVLQILAENSYGSPRQFLQYLERCIISEIHTPEKIYESFKFDCIDESNIYEYLVKVVNKDKSILNDIFKLNDIENFYFKCKTVLLEAGLYKYTSEIDDWKKNLANRLVGSGQDIMLLLQIWNEAKTYPYVDKADFIIKLIKWFDLPTLSGISNARVIKRG
jgi:DNA polymerase III gamma/tau subunit